MLFRIEVNVKRALSHNKHSGRSTKQYLLSQKHALFVISINQPMPFINLIAMQMVILNGVVYATIKGCER